jgi:PilZ domain
MSEADASSKPAATGGGATPDRRLVLRFRSQKDVTCLMVATNERVPGRLRDVSINGVGIIINRRLARGAALMIETKAPDNSSALSLSARVVHSTMVSQGVWLVGCTFTSSLSEQELPALL